MCANCLMCTTCMRQFPCLYRTTQRRQCYSREVSGTRTRATSATILGRDKHTCQVCGRRAVFSTTQVITPPEAPCAATVQIAVCHTCEPLFDTPFEDTPALEHLIQTRRTCNYGMPYLFAQLRCVTTPLVPITSLDADAVALLNMLRSSPDRIRLRTARTRLAHLTRLQFRRVLDQLEWHGYAYDGLEGSALLRMDYYARPPLLPNLTPIPNEPSLIQSLAEGRPLEHDPAAYLLANLYQHAGTVMSKRQLKKRLLLTYLPEDVFGPRLLLAHRALIGLGIIREQRSNYNGAVTHRLSRNLRNYTSLNTYAFVHQLTTIPNSDEWDPRLRAMTRAGLMPGERRAASANPHSVMRALRNRPTNPTSAPQESAA